MEIKMNMYGDNYVNEQQVAKLRKTINELEEKVYQKGGLIYNELDNKVISYDNGKIFEQRLIYELKKDNQKMVKMLAKINTNQQIARRPIVINQNITLNQESGTSLGLTMKGLIADTFFKLDRITKGISDETLLLP